MLVKDDLFMQMLEIIVVNDGSTDDTHRIGLEYEKKYPGTVRLLDKQNGGHGSTINAAVRIAKGKYFRVVDGDDWVVTKNLKKLLRQLKDCDVDIVGNDYYRVIDGTDKKTYVKSSQMQSNHVYSFEEIYEMYSFSMHAVTVKTELLRNPKLTIDENCFYVDVEYDTYLVYDAKTVLYLNYPLYMYRVGQAQQSVSAEGWWKHRDNHSTVAKSLINFYLFFKTNKPDEKGKLKFIKTKAKKSFAGHYTIIKFFDKRKRKEFKDELMNFDSCIKNSYGLRIYHMVDDDRFVFLCRKTKFNGLVISVCRLSYLIKEKIKYLVGRA